MLPSGQKTLTDQIGRRIRKLRISVDDSCNFRCHYCMPENSTFMSHDRLVGPDEIIQIASHLVDRGVEQIRVTGGEPTMRREFREIMEGISRLEVKKLGLTTNGLLLKKHLPFLRDIGCHHINISCDSLIPDKFNRITRRQSFEPVMDSIFAAREMNFPLKINVVLMRGVNDDEIIDFVEFAEKHDIPVRFLELMRIGQACSDQRQEYMPAQDAIDLIKFRRELRPVTSENDSTSFNFLTEKNGQIGFIASESRPFCGTCSRWRLSADGFLRACLMSDAGLSLKGLSPSEYDGVFERVLPMKPTGRLTEIRQNMNEIGG
ncbi:MAG: GTP 3',8-cyclase MoaA [Pseudomonadota bacterium]